MSDIDTAIARMKELEAKATGGEWESDCSDDGTGHDMFFIRQPEGDDWFVCPCKEDSDFIAFARQFVPQIIAAYEELKKENERLRTGAGA